MKASRTILLLPALTKSNKNIGALVTALVLSILFLQNANCQPTSNPEQSTQNRRIDFSGNFTYLMPRHWKVVVLPGYTNDGLQSEDESQFQSSIKITEIPGDIQKAEQDLVAQMTDNLKNYKQIKKEDLELLIHEQKTTCRHLIATADSEDGSYTFETILLPLNRKLRLNLTLTTNAPATVHQNVMQALVASIEPGNGSKPRTKRALSKIWHPGGTK